VPDNIYETGWYDGSSKPGQAGAMFIYGHVSSWTANGIFYSLKKLIPGYQITIIRGDNITYTYQVVSTKIYPYNNVNMSQVLAPINSNKPGLNLMTCTGQVMSVTKFGAIVDLISTEIKQVIKMNKEELKLYMP
jgi:sortase (surface protein transpeptidase)